MPDSPDNEGRRRVRLIRSAELSDVTYAYASTTVGATRPLHLAGACPLDENGATVAVGDVAGQAKQCIANLRTALAQASADLTDVLYTRVLVATTRREDLVAAWEIVSRAFADHDVPSTLVGVTTLGYPDQLVEVEAFAALGCSTSSP